MNLAETIPTESPPVEAQHSCEECGAPLELQQRYCVRCGTRNRNAASPAAEYFSRKGRPQPAAATAAAPPRRRRLASNAPALLLALLPVAVGVGVLLGKNGGSNDQQLIDALKNQKPVAASAAPTTAATAAAASSASKKSHASSKGHKSKTLSKTKFGSATQVSGSKPTAQKVQHDTNLVKKLQTQTGRSYLQQQTQGLPDTVVVGK